MNKSEETSKELGKQPKQRGVEPNGMGARFTVAFVVLALVSVVAVGGASLSVWSGIGHRDRLTEDVTKLEDKKGTLRQEINTIENEYKEKSKKREELDQLNRKIVDSERKTEDQIKKLNDLEKRIASRDAKLAGLNKSVDDATDREADLKRRIEDLVRERDNLTNNNSQLRDKAKNAQLEAKQDEGRISGKKEELNTLQRKVQDLENKRNLLQASVDKKNQEYRDLSGRYSEVAGIATISRDEVRNLESDVLSLKKQHDKASKDLVKTQANLKSSSAALRTAQSTLAGFSQKQEAENTLTQRIAQLKAQENELKESIVSKQKEIGGVLAQITQHNNTLGQINNQLESVQNDFQLAKSKSSELNRITAEVIIANESFKKAQEKLVGATSKLDALQSEALMRKAEVARATEDLRRLQQIKAQYKVTQKQLVADQQILNDVQAQINEQKILLETIKP